MLPRRTPGSFLAPILAVSAHWGTARPEKARHIPRAERVIVARPACTRAKRDIAVPEMATRRMARARVSRTPVAHKKTPGSSRARWRGDSIAAALAKRRGPESENVGRVVGEP
jgi:hypothetical protein